MKEIVVAAALLRKGDKFFIAKRPANKLPANVWEFPGGKPEEGETLEQTLQRELREELGIETKIGDFITQTTHIYDFAQVTINLFWAFMKDENAKIIDDEHSATFTAEDKGNMAIKKSLSIKTGIFLLKRTFYCEFFCLKQPCSLQSGQPHHQFLVG